jgi:single-strand DNA-binding protein
MLNSVLIDGNLTRDPELRTTTKGTKVCNFGLASNRFYEVDEEKVQEVSFFDIESWSKLGEACANHLTKGRGVRVIGRLKQDRWQTDDGQNRSRVKIVAEHIVFKPQIKQAGDHQGQEIEEGVEYALETAEAEPALL